MWNDIALREIFGPDYGKTRYGVHTIRHRLWIGGYVALPSTYS